MERTSAADVRTTAIHALACGNTKPQVGEAPMGAIGQRAEDVAWWGPRVCPKAFVHVGFLLPWIVSEGTFVSGQIRVRISDACGQATSHASHT